MILSDAVSSVGGLRTIGMAGTLLGKLVPITDSWDCEVGGGE